MRIAYASLPGRFIAAMLLLLLASAPAARAVDVQLSPEQKAASDKLTAKGGSVIQVASDTDQLTVDLGLAGKTITDDELAQVKLLPKVIELDLHGTAITDAGLAQIEQMTSLVRLHLEKTAVTDAGLGHLKALTNLEYLNLYDTAVTDAGLASLYDLKKLKKIYLWETKVTSAGATALKHAIDGVNVNQGEDLAVAAAPVTPEPEAPKPAPEAPKPAPAPAAPIKVGADLKPDDEGFIRNWLVLAPIPLNGVAATEALDKEQIAGEKDLKPREGDKIKAGEKELAWKPVTSGEFNLDFITIVGAETEQSVAYCVCYIHSAAEMKDLTLLFGSDDEAKIYLNGKEIAKANAARGLEKDSDKVAGLTLNTGVNVLIFKVINEGGPWQGCLRFKDKEGQPVKDLKLRLEP